jgi:hypothetical protein
MLRANQLLKIFLFLTVISFLAAGTFAGEKDKAEKPKKETSVSALKAGKDPADKQLREISKEDDQVLSERLRETLKKYPKQKLVTRPDGTKSLVVVPEFLNFGYATKDADGKVKHTCIKGEKPHTDQKQIQTTELQPEE